MATLTHEDLQAIAEIIDAKLDAKMETNNQHLTAQMEATNQRLDAKMAANNEILMKYFDEQLQPIKDSVGRLEYRTERLENSVGRLEYRTGRLENSVKRLEIINENKILPRLQHIEECYTSTFERYSKGIDQIDDMQANIAVLNLVVAEHSQTLSKLA